jgi:flavodoxin
MKTLVVFYSRTGTTRKVAEAISEALNCEVEEIFDTKKRSGILGYLRSGFDGRFKRLTVLEEIREDPSTYDLVIIWTPIWAGMMSAPIRSYISQHKDHFESVAFFCTAGSGKGDNAFGEMESLCRKKSLGLLELAREDASKDNYVEKVKEFSERLMQATQ